MKYTDIDPNYEFLPQEIFFATVCTILYGSGIARNLVEYDSIISSHKRQIRYEKNSFKISEYEDTHKELGKLIKKAKTILEKNGYNSEIDFISGRKYPRDFGNQK